MVDWQQLDPYLHDNWQHNATKWLGVPLHPLGELDHYSFVSGVYDSEHPIDRATAQARLRSVQFQLLFDVLLSAWSMRNLISFRIRTNDPTVWCCIFGSLLGVGVIVIATIPCLPVIASINISIVFSSAIVLHKAYLALCKQLWVAIIGAILLMPQFGFLYILIAYSPVTLTTSEACVVHYPDLLPWYWLAVTTPTNIFFSAIFTHVVYKQYRILGTAAWKELARDGIQTMSQIVVCNIICEILIATRVGDGRAELFFAVDWVITITVLVNHCINTIIKSTIVENNPNRNNAAVSSFVEMPVTATSNGRGYLATGFESFVILR
ncbi:hypothetical protein BDF22DRAFT_695657 [Syncephalis plumigaleata]|nr:hypothetical protein BDF22DRAFT_695657 [Syncephalis plumigaleata]